MTIQPTIQPKITDIKSAQAELSAMVKNPPQTPLESVRWMGSMLGANAALTTGLTMAFPMVGPILPALGGIFDLFSAGAPTIGEITLNAIADLSIQIDAGFKMLAEETQQAVEANAQKTIDVVLSGVDEIAKEASAVQVFEAYSATAAADIVRSIKKENYAVYLQDLQKLRAEAMQQIDEQLKEARDYVQQKFNQILSQIYAMIAELAPDMLDALNSYLSTSEKTTSGGAIETRSFQPAEKESNTTLLIGAAALVALFFITKKKN